jgi:hypothetical protein
MKVGYITKKMYIVESKKYTSTHTVITHRLYYKGDKIGNIPVVLAVKE